MVTLPAISIKRNGITYVLPVQDFRQETVKDALSKLLKTPKDNIEQLQMNSACDATYGLKEHSNYAVNEFLPQADLYQDTTCVKVFSVEYVGMVNPKDL